MRHFCRLSLTADVGPLLDQIDGHPELWDQHPWRRGPNSPHNGMSDIWVRYNAAERLGAHFNDEHVPVWYPAWKALPALRPLLFDLMAFVQGEMLCGVLITRVPPGEEIEPHADASWHVEYTEKFYLSLRSEPGARFHCGDESIEPKPGEWWLFDNRKSHWVTNDSEGDRITLIACIRTDLFGRY